MRLIFRYFFAVVRQVVVHYPNAGEDVYKQGYQESYVLSLSVELRLAPLERHALDLNDLDLNENVK